MSYVAINHSPKGSSPPPICSVITPVYNAERFISECIQSVLRQDAALDMIQLILFNDNSSDNSFQLISDHMSSLSSLHSVIVINSAEGPLGVGSARNRACQYASAPLLLFHDADDIMHYQRVSNTIRAFDCDSVHVVGGSFDRLPVGSTPRYQNYHSRLQSDQLFAYAFRDAPLAMPTVACRKSVWEKIKFREGRSVPEDLHFFYDCLKNGFNLKKIPWVLCTYRYHPDMTSFSLHRRTLLSVRVKAFEELVLEKQEWKNGFSIWGCGRDGKDVYKCLSESARMSLIAWGDVHPRKIGNVLHGKPIVHFSQLKPPIACCVALDREGRDFEANLASLNLREGVDYIFLI